jgi:hypothetical protein
MRGNKMKHIVIVFAAFIVAPGLSPQLDPPGLKYEKHY